VPEIIKIGQCFTEPLKKLKWLGFLRHGKDSVNSTEKSRRGFIFAIYTSGL